MSLLMGFIAKQGGTALTSSASVRRVSSRLGAHGGGAAAYLGFTFLIVALLLALLAAGQVTATRGEEAAGRLDHLLVRPVSRWSWLAGRTALTTAMLVISGLLAGFSAWLGAASQHSGVNLTSLLEAGINVIAPALCVLAAGVLAARIPAG